MQPQLFPSFEDYGAAIQHATVRVTITGPARAPWGLSHLPLRELEVQWGQAGGANIAEGQSQPGGVSILIPLHNATLTSANGHRYDSETFMLLGGGMDFCIAASDYNQWASVFIPDHRLSLMRGDDQEPLEPVRCEHVRPGSQYVDHLRDTVLRIITAAKQTPHWFAMPQSRDAAEAELERALRPVLNPASDGVELARHRAHAVPREQIIRIVTELLAHRIDDPLSVEQLATAADVSQRTLRTVFHDYFGVGPVRYAKLRTLHRARRELRNADPACTTVTKIASRLGIWEFGRFAHDYNDLFGEVPSQTLRNLRSKRPVSTRA
jgi:AraC family ethanolamine operon transcriptional activator